VQAAATAATAAATEEIGFDPTPTLRLVLLELNGYARNIFSLQPHRLGECLNFASQHVSRIRLAVECGFFDFVGLVIRLNRDSARHFEGRPLFEFAGFQSPLKGSRPLANRL